MSKTQHQDDLTREEIMDAEEFCRSKDRRTSSAEEFLEELQAD